LQVEEFLERSARRFPDKTALVCGDRRLTYGQVEELTLATPLVLPDSEPVHIQVHVAAEDETGRRDLQIHSRTPTSTDEWTLHATGILARDGLTSDPDLSAPWRPEWPPEHAEPVDLAGFYHRMAESGMNHGPSFKGLRAVWRHGDELFAEVAPLRSDPSDEDLARRTFLVLQDEEPGTRKKLPTLYTVFQLYCLKNLTIPQIARKCRCSLGTVANRLKLLQAKTGVAPGRLRRISPHFIKFVDDARQARRNYRRSTRARDL